MLSLLKPKQPAAQVTPQPAGLPQGAALPGHVAIIMDGNGRWAKKRGLPLALGHNQGGEAIRALVEACKTRPYIRYLTLYAFSLENWQRSRQEVADLMNLLRQFVKREGPTLLANNIRLRFIGDLTSLTEDIRDSLHALEEKSANNTALTVAIAISYGGRQEIALAARRMAEKVAAGQLSPEAITDETLAQHLYTADMPDPDLMIRTGGDTRISNFLLWQSAYTEFYFDPVLWPDFDGAHLDKAVEAFSKRERRYGKRNDA